MGFQSCPLTQTLPCHSSIICPVSSSGKQSMSFRELLCLSFTVTDKDQKWIRGAFCGRPEWEENGKWLWLFKVLRKGLHAGERDNWRYTFWQPKIVSECMILLRACCVYYTVIVFIWFLDFNLDIVWWVVGSSTTRFFFFFHLLSIKLDWVPLWWVGGVVIRISREVHLWVTGTLPLGKMSK